MIKYLTILVIALSTMSTLMADTAIWIIGDSTVSNYGKNVYPQTGWGQVLNNYCLDNVKVHNHAVPGRSTKSFLAEGRWEKVLKNMKSGDYLIIQFGHNDQKDYNKKLHAPANGLYKELLSKYISEATKKGVKTVLVTPVCRRLVVKGKIVNTLGDYPAAMKEVAKSTNSPVIDLNAISLSKFNEIGVEESKKLFLYFPAGTHKGFPKGAKDRSHFSELGAKKIAGWVVSDAKNQGLDIIKVFK